MTTLDQADAIFETKSQYSLGGLLLLKALASDDGEDWSLEVTLATTTGTKPESLGFMGGSRDTREECLAQIEKLIKVGKLSGKRIK